MTPRRRGSDLKHFRAPTGDWTPREEIDFMLWVFIDAGARYDEAVVEVNAVTIVFKELRDVLRQPEGQSADPR